MASENPDLTPSSPRKIPTSVRTPGPGSWVRRPTLLAAILALTAFLFLFGQSKFEPSYQGVQLSAWIDQYALPGTSRRQQEAASAVRAIGPRAIPVLIRWIGQPDRPWRTKLPQWLSTHTVFKTGKQNADEERRRAAFGFRALGPAGTAAAPRLAPYLSDPKLTTHAAAALAGIGPQTWPYLARALGHTNHLVVVSAARAISEFGPSGAGAAPALLAVLRGDNWMTHGDACEALLKIEADKTIVAAVLLENLAASKSIPCRNRAAYMLRFFKSPTVMAGLERASNDPDSDFARTCWDTLNILWRQNETP